jgi:hypothetical protein
MQNKVRVKKTYLFALPFHAISVAFSSFIIPIQAVVLGADKEKITKSTGDVACSFGAEDIRVSGVAP